MSSKEELTLEEQVERIHRRKQRHADHDKVREALNYIFLLLAAVGLIWYFCDDDNRFYALGVIAVGMVLKIVEFFIRFMG